jgi:putative DNA-invertase from lambdoid prophage Rac
MKTSWAQMSNGCGAMIYRLQACDVLIVTKLDRLGRNAMDVRATVERLEEIGAGFSVWPWVGSI